MQLHTEEHALLISAPPDEALILLRPDGMFWRIAEMEAQLLTSWRNDGMLIHLTEALVDSLKEAVPLHPADEALLSLLSPHGSRTDSKPQAQGSIDSTDSTAETGGARLRNAA